MQAKLIVPILFLLVAAMAYAQPAVVMPASLFSDRKAIQIGDVVTILLMEYSAGSNEASTNTGLEHSLEASSGATGGQPTGIAAR